MVDGFCEKLTHLLEIASDNGIVLAMENTYEPDLTLFEEIFEHFPPPFLGMCFDTGHAACLGKVPPQMVAAFSDHICHFHEAIMTVTRFALGTW